MVFSFAAVSRPSPCEILKTYKNDFLAHVNPTFDICRLSSNGVISADVERTITKATNEEAKKIMYKYLVEHANLHRLRQWCDWAKGADGYSEMQNLGKKMGKELE